MKTFQIWNVVLIGALVLNQGILLGFLTAQATENVPLPVDFSLKLPDDEIVSFAGMLSGGGAGSARNMAYPAPNMAVFLATIVAHGVIQKTFSKSRDKKLLNKANEVLIPYQDILSAYKNQELMESSLALVGTTGTKRLLAHSDTQESKDLVIESVPMFFMTQDQKALIVDNAVAIKTANSEKPYQNVVRIVSPVKNAEDMVKFWSEDNGRNLKAESQRLYAQSLEIALNDRAKPNTGGTPKTIRYLEGGKEKMERGELLSEQNNQVLLRTLRGHLMLVPQKT